MKNQTNNQKTHGLAMRILLLVLVALMVISLAFYSIWMIVDNVRTKKAEKEKAEREAQEEADDEHDHEHSDDEDDPEKYY